MDNKTNKVLKLSIEILVDLMLGIVETPLILMAGKKEIYRAAYQGYDRKLTYERMSSYFSSLKKRGYIEYSIDSKSIVLTDKARIKAIETISNSMVADGKFRFVSFDIPEEFSTRRNNFRRFLKRLGFVQIQKSFWVCNKNVGEMVDLAAKEYRVEKYMAYIITEKTDINEFIRKKLDVKKLDIKKRL